jgi:hypothetical protein
MKSNLPLLVFAPVLPPSSLPRAIQLERLLPLIPLDIQIITSKDSDELPGIRTIRLGKRRNKKIFSVLISKFFPRLFPITDNYLSWSLQSWLHYRKQIYPYQILTCGQPHSTHLIGLLNKRKSGQYWTAHLSDPIWPNQYDGSVGIRRFIRKYFQRLILSKADSIIVTTPQLRDYLNGLLGSKHSMKVNFLPHLRGQINLETGKVSDGFSIVHTGSLYEPRSLSGVINALEHFTREYPDLSQNTRLILVGDLSKSNLYLANEIERLIETHVIKNRLTRKQVDTFCLQADLLLTLEPDLTENLSFPSKIVDYLSYKTPQLIVTRSGFAQELLRGLNGFYVHPERESRAIAEDLAMLHQTKMRKQDVFIDDSILSFFSQDNVSRMLKDILI